jgi:large subunit ribosomal protein L7/L12
MARHIDEHIAALETKLKQARALKQKLEAQKRAIERKKKRREDTRRKVLVGACVLRSIEGGEWPQEKLQELLDKSLSRNDDRALFDLPPLPPKPKQPSEPNETPEPPQA